MGVLDVEKRKTRWDKYYSVGYLPAIDKYVIEVVVSWIAWFYRYYEISAEEYALFETDVEKLDKLADDVYHNNNGEGQKRFLFSDRIPENTKEQLELHTLCRKRK